MLKKDKENLVKTITDIFDQNHSLIFFSYNKLNVSAFTQLRLSLKKSGANLKVVKNTLAKIALKNSNHAKIGSEKFFKGSSMCIVYGEISLCAKELQAFIQANDNSVNIVGGIADKEIFEHSKFNYFVNLPSKEGLIGKINTLIASPLLALQKVIASPAITLKKIGVAISSENNN